MLAAERHWEQARGAPLPAPRALGRRRRARRRRGAARLPARGGRAGHRAALRARGGGAGLGQRAARQRLLRAARTSRPAPPGRSSSAAASASPRWRCCGGASRLAECRPRSCSAFATASTVGGLDDLFSNCQIGLASDDGHLGERGYVTDLLAAMLEGDDAGERRRLLLRPAADAGGGRRLCPARGVACELAMESPMACGFGACFGCAVPKAGGGLPAALRGRPDRAGRRMEVTRMPELAGSGSSTRSSTARGPSTRSRPAASTETRCWSSSPSPPSSRRRSPPSPVPGTSRSGSGRPRRG